MDEVETDTKADSAAQGAKERSEIQYPYFGLAHAIAIVEAVRRAGGNEALSADVMREMGIALKTDRKWSYGVPTAALFGLVERVGRGDTGRIKLTELGLRVALPGNAEEATAARVSAFRTPELYQLLVTRFAAATVPTKDGLRNLLHRDYKIVESMALGAAEAFIESLTTAGLVSPTNTIVANGAPAAEDRGTGNAARGNADPPPPPNTKPIYVPADFVIYKCKIAKGRVIDIPLPSDFKMADVNRLYAFLQTQVDDDPSEVDPAT